MAEIGTPTGQLDERFSSVVPQGLRPFKPEEFVENDDGTISSERTVTIADQNGQFVNAPSLWMGQDGPVDLGTDEDAIGQALNAFETEGESLPRFDNLDGAVKAAQARSRAGGAGAPRDAVESGLVTDSPDADTVDQSLVNRSQAQTSEQDIQWMLSVGEEDVDPMEFAVNDNEIPVVQESEDPLYKRVIKDVGRGAVEAPRQIVGGIVDAFESVADAGDKLLFSLGGIQILDEKGNFDLAYMSPEEYAKLEEDGKTVVDALRPDAAESGTGALIRGAAQFVAPFVGVFSKAAKGIKAFDKFGKGATLARSAAAGATTDALAFDAHEARLSNFVEQFPALKNPVTEYLAADPEDSEVEGRLKNAVEGLILGPLGEATFAGIKAIKQARAAKMPKEDLAEALRMANREDVLRDAKQMNLLGDTADDARVMFKKFRRQQRDTRQRRGARKIKEPDLGVPDDVAAKALAQGATEVGEGSGVFVNWARIQTPDDIKKVMDDMATAFQPDIDKARRGVKTNIQTAQAAKKVDAFETLLARRTGQPLNASQSLAARQLWASAGEKLFEVSKAAADTPTPENLYQFRQMMAVYNAIQKDVIAARTETARALQSWSIPAGGNQERIREIDRALQLSGGSDVSKDMASRIAALSELPDGMNKLSKFAEKGWGAKSLDGVQEYWINALLSGPKTHVVNAMSNASVIAMTLVERRAAALINTGDGVAAGETISQVQGIVSGFGDALKNAAQTAWSGKTGYGVNKIEAGRTRALSSSNWNIRSESVFGRGIDAFGMVVNIPGRAMQTADEFFKTINYRMEVHAQAHRQAVKELDAGDITEADLKSRMADIVADPPESIRLESANAAALNTFTSPPGELTRGIQSLVAKAPVARFIVPFINTPANILNYTFARTPLAPLSKRYRNAIAKGGAEADLARTKMTLGTLATMYSIDMGMRGQITGGGPSSPSERANWARQGFRQYSAKIGDTWVAYNRLDPLGYLLGMGADIAEYVNNADMSDPDLMFEESQEAVSAAVFSIVENITSKSYMQGLANLTEAINDPKRFASRYFEGLFSSFVPSVVGEIARQQDPVMRVSHDMVTAFKRRLPGYSDDLPPRRDLWGREQRYESGLGTTYDTLSPLYAHTPNPEPIDKAMQRDGWYAGMPSKILTVDGEKVGLKNRPEVYERYLMLQAQTKPEDMEAYGLADRYDNKTMLEVVNDIVTGKSELSERYDRAEDPDEKRDVIMKVINRYRRAARKVLIREFPDLQLVAERKRKSRIDNTEE